MNIAENLMNRFNTKLAKYFNSDKWEKIYKMKLSTLNHDEPWLTLIAIYSIFGNQQSKNTINRIEAINEILFDSGLRNELKLTSVDKITVEDKLPEIIEFRNYLRNLFSKEIFHLYPDRRNEIIRKMAKKNASFEGNTNLDLKIIGSENGIKKYIFIEAKFLSDISYQIKYNPVRDQIIRNIDAGIDFIMSQKKDSNKDISFKNFFFFLLTPQIFRPTNFGVVKSSKINNFQPSKGRLYCYKMIDYLNYNNLKMCLPHRNLSDNDWFDISSNIGWITFESFINNSLKSSTIDDISEQELIKDFYAQRNLYLK
jgi:hypothetical protein